MARRRAGAGGAGGRAEEEEEEEEEEEDGARGKRRRRAAAAAAAPARATSIRGAVGGAVVFLCVFPPSLCAVCRCCERFVPVLCC
jgi:hypothetical protein